MQSNLCVMWGQGLGGRLFSYCHKTAVQQITPKFDALKQYNLFLQVYRLAVGG